MEEKKNIQVENVKTVKVENQPVKKQSEKDNKKLVQKIKEEKLQKRVARLNNLNKFDLLPDIDLSKKEVKVLKMVYTCKGVVNYLDLIRKVDMKPSTLTEILKKLSKNKLVTCQNDVITILETGVKFANKNKDQEKKNRKFKRFVEVLSDEEFEEFCKVCSDVKSDISINK